MAGHSTTVGLTQLVCESCGKTGHFSLNRVRMPNGKRAYVCEDCERILAPGTQAARAGEAA